MFVFSRQTDILLRDNPWKLFQARKNDKRLSLDCACAGQDVCAQAQYFFSSPQAVTQQLGCCQAITRPQSLIHPCPCSSLCLLSLGSFWSSETLSSEDSCPEAWVSDPWRRHLGTPAIQHWRILWLQFSTIWSSFMRWRSYEKLKLLQHWSLPLVVCWMTAC